LLKDILAYCGYSPTSPFFLLLSEHKHCDNAATNTNSENAISRKVGKFARKRGYGDKGRWVKYWAPLGCWISPCYCPLSLGARFETFERFISLIPILFSGRGKLRILNLRIRGPPVIISLLIRITDQIFESLMQSICRAYGHLLPASNCMVQLRLKLSSVCTTRHTVTYHDRAI